MSFDDLQKAWKSQKAEGRVTIPAKLLLQEVRQNQRQFQGTIFWRDVREIGVAFIMTLYFSYIGWKSHDWTDFLIAAACFGVGTFMLVDRRRQRKAQPVANDSVRSCIETSLVHLKHQIWLLRNIFWWYLLPIATALGISMLHDAWQGGHSPLYTTVKLSLSLLVIVLLYWGVYWLNQFAVRKDLEPRRRELETLLESLGKSPG